MVMCLQFSSIEIVCGFGSGRNQWFWRSTAGLKIFQLEIVRGQLIIQLCNSFFRNKMQPVHLILKKMFCGGCYTLLQKIDGSAQEYLRRIFRRIFIYLSSSRRTAM
jgi:hypothetical protein